MVTFNARDFARIARDWAGEGRHHAGCAILLGIDHGELAVIFARLTQELAARPEPAAWEDYTAFVGRHRVCSPFCSPNIRSRRSASWRCPATIVQ